MKIDVNSTSIQNALTEGCIPIGETNYDTKAAVKLDTLVTTVDICISKLVEVSKLKNVYQEDSIQECSKIAGDYLRELKNELKELL